MKKWEQAVAHYREAAKIEAAESKKLTKDYKIKASWIKHCSKLKAGDKLFLISANGIWQGGEVVVQAVNLEADSQSGIMIQANGYWKDCLWFDQIK